MRQHGLGMMPTWQRWFVITSFATCSISGLAFLVGHEFRLSSNLLGSHSVLAMHGIASALALMALGTVMPFHLKAGLKSKKNLYSGIIQLFVLALLIMTGLLLYYGPEEIHDLSKVSHWLIGLSFIPLFFIHLLKHAGRLMAKVSGRLQS